MTEIIVVFNDSEARFDLDYYAVQSYSTSTGIEVKALRTQEGMFKIRANAGNCLYKPVELSVEHLRANPYVRMEFDFPYGIYGLRGHDIHVKNPYKEFLTQEPIDSKIEEEKGNIIKGPSKHDVKRQNRLTRGNTRKL